MNDWDEKQVETWNGLYDRVTNLLARYGSEYHLGKGDYSVVEDNYGWRRVTVSAHHLKMLRPEIVVGLRGFLSELPDWEITVAVDVLGKENEWPIMGLTIRKHEIIDGLHRQFFPQAFQNLTYTDSRPGTGYD